MKALGIIRKIDELGRVVIPKEVRRTQGWEDGAPMEMFMSEDGLVIRKYGQAAEKLEIINEIQNVMQLTDNEEVYKIMEKTLHFIAEG